MTASGRQNHCSKKTLAAGLVLALLTALALCWCGYAFVRHVDDQSKYVQVHEFYTEDQIMTATDPAQGWLQTIQAGPETPLYGVRLYFTTFNRVVRGTLYVDLLDESGQKLAQGVCDMTEIIGLDYQAILFEKAVYPTQAATQYTLHIYYQPQTAEDVLGLLYGTGEMPQLELDENGIPLLDENTPAGLNAANSKFPLVDAATGTGPQATAAIQYLVNYSGQIGMLIFAPVAVLVFCAVLGGWWLLFCKSSPLWVCFAWVGGCLCAAYLWVTPPMAGPDEYTHLAASYSMASQMMGQEGAYAGQDEQGNTVSLLPMRSCDAPHMRNRSGQGSIFAYKAILDDAENTWGNQGELTHTAKVVISDRLQPVLQLPSALGILVARLLGLGFYPMLMLGRGFSAAVYLALMSWAVAKMPYKPGLLCAAALLPMGMELAACFSTDTMILGMSFLFISLCLNSIQQSKPVSLARQGILLVLAACLAPAKAVYVLLIALALLIPAQNLGGRRRSIAFKILLCGVSAMVWLGANLQTVVYLVQGIGLWVVAAGGFAGLAGIAALVWLWRKLEGKPDLRRWLLLAGAGLAALGLSALLWKMQHGPMHFTEADILANMKENGDCSIVYNLGYTLSNLPRVIRLLANTFTRQLPVYLQGLVGALPGEPIVHHLELSWITTMGLLLVLVISGLPVQGENGHPSKKVCRSMGAILAGVALLIVMAALSWTPANYQVIFGIQGRYLLPVLPLGLVLLGQTKMVQVTRDAARPLCLASACLGSAAVVESLLLFCGV